MEKTMAFIKTIQPYFVMQTDHFQQYIMGAYGISHFYSYDEYPACSNRAVVPDGCLDILFEYGSQDMQVSVCGTVLQHKIIERGIAKTCFGVRFFPGFLPAFIQGKLTDFIDKQIPLEELLDSMDLIYHMTQARTFLERISVFMQFYKKTYREEQRIGGAKLIIHMVEQMIYGSHGEIQIKEIEEQSGYTARYINKLFHREIGLNPKKFCLIIKFQRFLTQLHCTEGESMANLAVEYGYFDQAYLSKEFSKYTNLTPMRYFRLLQESKYRERIVTYQQKNIG